MPLLRFHSTAPSTEQSNELRTFGRFLVVGVLYIWGGPGIHLFAFMMLIGVVVGSLSTIYVATPLLLILGEGRVTERESRRRPQGRAREHVQVATPGVIPPQFPAS